MATQITLFQAKDGTQFTTETEANAHDVQIERAAEIDAFVAEFFPSKDGAKKKNPHAGTAKKAIALWLGSH
jgi:hypothetical protein